MGKAHDKLIDDILAAVGNRDDLVIWRNFTGVVRAYSQPQKIFFAGCKGSADLLGVLGPAGTLLAIEAKVGRDVLQQTQIDWSQMVIALGGLFLSVHRAQEVVERLDSWRTSRMKA